MIIDTNALSAFLQTNAALISQLSKIEERPVLPVIVIGEYRYGVKFSRYGDRIERHLGLFLKEVMILDITLTTSRMYAEIRAELRRKGFPIPTNDVWIAALARQHHLPILSQDKHFDLVDGVDRIGW